MNILANVLLLTVLAIGCKKADKPAPGPSAGSSATAPSEPAPSEPAVKPADPVATGSGSAELKPLSAYLETAVSAKVFSIKPLTTGGMDRKLVKELGEPETKAYLGTLDLGQRATGGLAKCPSDM